MIVNFLVISSSLRNNRFPWKKRVLTVRKFTKIWSRQFASWRKPILNWVGNTKWIRSGFKGNYTYFIIFYSAITDHKKYVEFCQIHLFPEIILWNTYQLIPYVCKPVQLNLSFITVYENKHKICCHINCIKNLYIGRSFFLA